MPNYTLRVRVHDPINGRVLPGISGYRPQEFKCEVEQIIKSECEDEIIFYIDLPKYYVFRLRDKDEVKKLNIAHEFGNQLDILSDELSDFTSKITDVIDLEEREIDREQLDKIKKVRADLEKIKLEFGEIL